MAGKCYTLHEFTIYLRKMPMFGGLGDGVGDVGAGGPEEHQLVGPAVHHVEEGLHPDGGVALQRTKRPNLTLKSLLLNYVPEKYTNSCEHVQQCYRYCFNNGAWTEIINLRLRGERAPNSRA